MSAVILFLPPACHYASQGGTEERHRLRGRPLDSRLRYTVSTNQSTQSPHASFSYDKMLRVRVCESAGLRGWAVCRAVADSERAVVTVDWSDWWWRVMSRCRLVLAAVAALAVFCPRPGSAAVSPPLLLLLPLPLLPLLLLLLAGRERCVVPCW